jgi:dolichyl-phosphate beta-glucosyltransferase
VTTVIHRLSVVVPAYNEQDCIAETLEKILSFLAAKPFDYEIIVVDDGSTDRTSDIVTKLRASIPKMNLLKNDKNRGKGAAVRRGVLSANGDFVLFLDADFSTPIEEFDKFQPHLENGAHVVIGSRRERDSAILVRQPWYRVYMGHTFSILARVLLAPPIHDFTCGFKCLEASAAKKIFGKQSLDDWSFDAEILHIAYKKKFQIMQVPVSWENHPDSKVKIIESTIKAFWGIIKIRLNSLLGKY